MRSFGVALAIVCVTTCLPRSVAASQEPARASSPPATQVARRWIRIPLTNKAVNTLDLEKLRKVAGVFSVTTFDPGNSLIACVSESGGENLKQIVKLIDQGIIDSQRETIRIIGANFKFEVSPTDDKKVRVTGERISLTQSDGKQSVQVDGNVRIVIEGPQDFKVTLTADQVVVETIREPKGKEGS